ncbi:MAG: hypothetical protein DRO15_04900 [Thermoprotei archaeon]|nr:MAG: hypothetical protein DRO15_04900 [Thermoprotei archaeon]
MRKFKYSKDHKPSAPIIKALIITARGRKYELELLVDIGFSGGILIPYNLYEELKLALFEVPEKYYGILPIGVPITLHTALAKVVIDGLEFKIHIHSHPLINKKLAGRELLNKMKILLNGPMEELELLNK